MLQGNMNELQIERWEKCRKKCVTNESECVKSNKTRK